MGLFGSLEVARSGLGAATDLSTVVSRNLANVDKPLATVKTGKLVTLEGGGVRMESISRTADNALFTKLLSASSDASAQQAIVSAAGELHQTIGDPQNDVSPAALLGKLNDALQQYEAQPSSVTAAQSAVSAASTLADSLRRASTLVQDVRQRADTAMSESAEKLRKLLDEFWSANSAVVSGTLVGADISDKLDQRDQTLYEISGIIGVKVVTRPDNNMSLYTDSGVTLFETEPRSIRFETTPNISAGNPGGALLIDGVAVTGAHSPMPLQSGELAGLAQVRDRVAATYQGQLDELARGLVAAFAEKDQSEIPELPDAPGLFTYDVTAGAATVPEAGILVSGMAATLKVNPVLDPAQGGNPVLLRDGGINGPEYVYNTNGAAGYQGRLSELRSGLNIRQPFDASAQLGSAATLLEFSSSSAAWLEQTRRTASDTASYKDTLQQETLSAIAAKTGVNMDSQMMQMIEFERSYQASAKIITTIDNMFNSLLSAVG